MCLMSTSALANSSGSTGNSGKNASMTCNTCHTGGTAPTVTITGPETLAPGATGQYTLTIQGGPAMRGGMNVALSAGTTASLEPGAGLQKLSGELTHSAPKAFANGTVSFDFSVVAPATAGTFTLFGSGNSTNGNNAPPGDRAGLVQLAVNVTGGTEPGPDNDEDKGGCSSTGGAPVLMFALAAAGMTLLRRRRS